MSPFVTACPFIAGILFVLVSPLLVTRVKRSVQAQIRQDREHLGISFDTDVPPPLAPKVINDYIEYAVDGVQIIPITLLPVIGAVFTVSTNGATMPTLILLCSMVLIAVVLDLVVTNSSTADYASRKFYGYSIAALVALCSNVIGMIVSISTAPAS